MYLSFKVIEFFHPRYVLVMRSSWCSKITFKPHSLETTGVVGQGRTLLEREIFMMVWIFMHDNKNANKTFCWDKCRAVVMFISIRCRWKIPDCSFNFVNWMANRSSFWPLLEALKNHISLKRSSSTPSIPLKLLFCGQINQQILKSSGFLRNNLDELQIYSFFNFFSRAFRELSEEKNDKILRMIRRIYQNITSRNYPVQSKLV